MSKPREVSSVFLQQQIPTDFSCIKNVLNCLPSNVDGITERLGHFLVFELKHGEQFSRGQELMLRAWADKPGCTILAVNCQYTEPNEKHAREFHPLSFYVMGPKEDGPEHPTTVKDFAARYDVWCRVPQDGPLPFTCSVAEFQEKYVRLLPQCEQGRAMAAVMGARPE